MGFCASQAQPHRKHDHRSENYPRLEQSNMTARDEEHFPFEGARTMNTPRRPFQSKSLFCGEAFNDSVW